MFDQRPPTDAPARASGVFRAASLAVGTSRQTVLAVGSVRYFVLGAVLYLQGVVFGFGLLISLPSSESFGGFMIGLILGGRFIGGMFYAGTWGFRKAFVSWNLFCTRTAQR